ncbi:Amino acid permease 2 [Morella rubra]|uniref:Amino acid permease 2 n=1 Tax=Morella rubra TaxID=262757 RepID=A0A6A1WN21_9ROSI|nr:Amino acid permease 2 [Morella rubra]
MVEDTATTDQLSGDVRLPLGSSEGLDNDGQRPKSAVDGQSKRTGNLYLSVIVGVKMLVLVELESRLVYFLLGLGCLFFGGLKDLRLRGENMAQLGWVAGPAAMICFSFLAYYTSRFLLNRPGKNTDTGKKNSYMDVVESNLGRRHAIVCFVVQYLNLLVVASKYTQEAAFRMMDLIWYACHHGKRTCRVYQKPYNIAAGVIQIFFSQIPDFDQLGWLSSLSVVTFITFSAIGLGLSIGRVTENEKFEGRTGGMSLGNVTRAQKMRGIFKAFGDIALAYDFFSVLIDIEDTIESPQPDVANQIMKKATKFSLVATTFVYLVYGGLEYAAFGENVAHSLFWNPYWLLDIRSLAMLINYVGAYQIFSQPMFAMVEKFIGGAVTNCEFATKDIEIPIPCFTFKTNLLRLVCRSGFVITTTVMSMFLPVYNGSLQLVDGIAFWFLGIYFPLEMYKKEKQKYSGKWLCAQIVIIGVLILTIASVAAKFVDTFIYIDGSSDPLMPNYDS